MCLLLFYFVFIISTNCFLLIFQVDPLDDDGGVDDEYEDEMEDEEVEAAVLQVGSEAVLQVRRHGEQQEGLKDRKK
jgi:hypothetical protein